MPKTENRREALLAALSIAYLYRNVNLASPLIGVSHRADIRLITSPDRQIIAFDFMRSQQLFSALGYLYCNMTGCEHNLFELDTDESFGDAKMSWVGFRGASKYSSAQEPRFGMEYRVYSRHNRSTRDQLLHRTLIRLLDDILAKSDLHQRLLANLPTELKRAVTDPPYNFASKSSTFDRGTTLSDSPWFTMLSLINFNEDLFRKISALRRGLGEQTTLPSIDQPATNTTSFPQGSCLFSGDEDWWRLLYRTATEGPETGFFSNVFRPSTTPTSEPDNAQVYMMWHNWACDPLLTDDPTNPLSVDDRKKLQADQLKALTRIDSAQSAIEQMALLAEQYEFQKHTLAWLSRLAN